MDGLPCLERQGTRTRFLIHSKGWINEERMSLLLQNSGGIWKSMPSRFLLAVGFVALDSRGAKLLGSFGNLFRFPSVFDLGKSLGSQENRCRGWISQYLPRLGGARIHLGFSHTLSFRLAVWAAKPASKSCKVIDLML